MPRISPYLLYEDVGAAVDWLVQTCGFKERSHERMSNDAGQVVHTALEYAEGVVMMGHPGPDYRGPHRHGHYCQMLYIYVDDVDAHHAHAVAQGAKVVSGPEDVFYGDRRYRIEDPEGHQWEFAQRTRDVAPEDWKQGG